MNNTKFCVYRHTSPSGKIYIGITSLRPERRWCSGAGYKHNEYFFRAILKYGWDHFTHEILAEGLTREAACEIEIALIAKYKSNNPVYGYNITAGGDHAEHAPATIEKISAAKRGRVLEEEHRRKISEANKGKPLSDEHRQKLSDAHRGKVLSEEHRQKMSAAHQGVRRSAETKAKIQEASRNRMKRVICIETNEVYNSLSEASRKNQIHQSAISGCCNGIYQTAGGKHWRFCG